MPAHVVPHTLSCYSQPFMCLQQGMCHTCAKAALVEGCARGGDAWQMRGELSWEEGFFSSCLPSLASSLLLFLKSQVGKETPEETCVQGAGKLWD